MTSRSACTGVLILFFLGDLGARASLQVGWGGHAQLNTTQAIWNGMQLFDGVEIDLQATKDGVVIGLHDEVLDNETNGSGLVSDHNWRDLRGLMHHNGAPIARLVDMLKIVDRHEGFAILDVRDVPVALVKRALDEALFAYHFTKIAVFDHAQGGAYIGALPGAQVFYKTGELPSTLDDDALLAEFVALGYSGVAFPTWTEFPSLALMDKIRSHGLFTYSFIVTSQAEADASTAVGIDYVVSNGNLYAFPPVAGAPPAIEESSMSAQTFGITTTVPRLFRQLFVEEYRFDAAGETPPWQKNGMLVPVRLSPTRYRFEIPTDSQARGIYRVRIVEQRQ